ncbi:hypothetical protein [Streptomyces sp. C1-2]|uniref:hypothetical protein n=1 Tax=Streptomyces sp. C1-2 TaxID=2720022 RepID=UPI0014327366|nr:hypothetical protein [Streptomyces sp. C1-2]NJP73733.1 hypothetical protein [Streptomyces sp. C1-2]
MRTSIPFEAVGQFLEQLGVDPDATAAVEITPHCVTVSQFRLNEAGARFAVGGGPALVKTDIRIDRS